MDFNSLLQEAQKLNNETHGSEDLPRMERSLPLVLKQSEELHSRVTQTGSQDIQAHKLLGSNGIDVTKLSQKLETINASKTFEPLDPVADTDVHRFLKNEKENAILSAIEQVQQNSYNSAQEQRWEHTLNDWQQEKIKILNALIVPSENWLDATKTPQQTILNDTTSRGVSTLNHMEMAFANEVLVYNKSLEDGSGDVQRSVLQKFIQVAHTCSDAVSDIWEMIKYITNVPWLPHNKDLSQSRSQSVKFVEQAKKYLENGYKRYISLVIKQNLRKTKRGGVPSTLNLIKCFVGFHLPEDSRLGLEDGDTGGGLPLWPMVYYCLRSGDIQSAILCLQESSSNHDKIIQALEERKASELRNGSRLEIQLKMQYKRTVKNGTDPYKKLVFCLLAACDIYETHSEIAKTIDDYLWIQLSIIRHETVDGTDVLTLPQLQKTILEEHGEKYFNASEKPLVFFGALTLTGQFEAAIEFLSRFENYRVHAVHIAIALNEIFMIGLPRNVEAPLLSVDIADRPPMRRLNIARLILLYVKKFEITDPAEALQYFWLLRNLRDPNGDNLFLICVSDLCFECREFHLIFGTIQENGVRSHGLIDQFVSVNIGAKSAAKFVGERFVEKGMFEDAIKMFDLADDQQKALHYTSMLLSQVVHQPDQKGSLRDRLKILSKNLYERYCSDESNTEPKDWTAFVLLRDLLNFFDLYYQKKFENALTILERTNLIPISTNDLDRCLENFKRLDGEVTKVYPEVLLATMNILYTQYKTVRAQTAAVTDTEKTVSVLRSKAKAITNMAASIPYRMPGDMNSRLVQTEILMH